MPIRDPASLARRSLRTQNLGGNSNLTQRRDQPASGSPLWTQPAYPAAILVLGFSQTDLLHLPAGLIPEHASVHFTTLGALVGDVLQDIQPTRVISPLISGGSDAAEVARHLSGLGFKGEFKVLTTSLPRPDMVQAEISSIAPDVAVELIDISTPSTP